MKSFLKPIWITILCGILSVLACVTINIYFPAEQVESVAGEIVDEIRGRTPAGDKESSSGMLRLVMSPSIAWAQDYTNVSNPTIRALKEKMKARYSLLKPFYNKGILKEGNDGYLSSGKTSGLSVKEKRDIKNLVTAENNDRKALYEEVTKALKIDPSQTQKVGEIFAKEWQKPQ